MVLETIPLIEDFVIVSEVISESSSWQCPGNRSMNGSHISRRFVEGDYYNTFINATLDSIIICNTTQEYVRRFSIPVLHGALVSVLYFHNPDSVFLFFNRQFIYRSRIEGRLYPDFILCNSNGDIINEYSLDEVPHIYNGQINPMLEISPFATNFDLIYRDRIYLPMAVYLPQFDDVAHKDLKLKLLCEFNLSTKSLRMLNVTIPDELIGKQFKSESARSVLPSFLILNDSVLLYGLETHGSLFQYNLNTDVSKEVFSAEQFPVSNNTVNDSEPEILVFFNQLSYSRKDNFFIRTISVSGYKGFKPFAMAQLFDDNFGLIGYQLLKDRSYYQFNGETFGRFFFDRNEHLSVRPMDKEGIYYHIRPGTPVMRSMAYIEEHYLKKQDEDVVTMRFAPATPYEKRMVAYLNELNIPIGSRVILVGLHDACLHCVELLLNACRKNHELFRSQEIFYLYVGPQPDLAAQVFQAYQVPEELILVDERRLYQEFFLPEEYTLYPLVHYKESGEVELVIYDFRSCAEDLRQFLEVR